MLAEISGRLPSVPFESKLIHSYSVTTLYASSKKGSGLSYRQTTARSGKLPT